MSAFRLPCWIDLLLPTAPCRLCGATSCAPLCPVCLRERLDPGSRRCLRCGLRLPRSGWCGACLRRPPPFGPCLTLADYSPPLDTLLHALKFGDEPALGRWFGRELGQRWRDTALPLPHAVLPVPLSPRRLRDRGYNQSWEIARALAAAIGRPAHSDLLLRARDDVAQSTLPLPQRRRNVAGAFSCSGRVDGLALLLVDDVMSSGSTAAAAARPLLDAGARSVMLAVALRTPAPD